MPHLHICKLNVGILECTLSDFPSPNIARVKEGIDMLATTTLSSSLKLYYI